MRISLIFKATIFIVAILFIPVAQAGISLLSGRQPILEMSDASNISHDDLLLITKFNKQWELIVKYFVHAIPNTPVAKRECFEKTLQGGISFCLNDQNSAYYTIADMQEMKEERAGEFYGVGITLISIAGQVVVDSLSDGGPAALSGKVNQGDVIVMVDGEGVRQLLPHAIQKIRGSEGTAVTLTLKRGGKILNPVVLVRARIEVPSVESAVIDQRTTLIKINSFGERTHLEFVSALVDAFEGKNDRIDFSRRIVIDLRDNPGGLVNVVVLASALFAGAEDDEVVVIRGRSGEVVHAAGTARNIGDFKFLQNFGGMFAKLFAVVLVNERSASAAEIFSGILQQWGVAKIVGMPTYGKGSAQSIIPLEDGGGLKLTTAEYFVGKGRVKVNGIGITPDVVVENIPPCGDEAKRIRGKKKPLVDLVNDAQLRAALEILNKKK